MNFLSTIGRWAAGVFIALFPFFKSAARAFLCDPELQRLALHAVRAARNRGLYGDAAWDVARAQLLAALKRKGLAVASNWTDTLLQNAYFLFANPQ